MEKEDEEIDQMSQDYLNLDETGREKLLEISKKVFEIFETVNKEKSEVFYE